MNAKRACTRLAKCLKQNVLPPNATSVRLHDINRHTKQGAAAVIHSIFLTYVSEGLKQRKDFVLKIYRKQYEKDGPKEFEVLKALKGHNLPVPTAYYFNADNRIIGNPFLIMEKNVGNSASHYLTDEVNGQIMVDKMAKILVRVHKLDPNCIKGSNKMQERYQFKQQEILKLRFFINKRCMNFLGFCPLRPKRFVAAVKRLEEAKPKKFRPAILHREYGPEHVLVSNRRFIIVDWGDASIGDPAFDVAWTYHELRLGRAMAKVDLGEHFVKSYEKYMGQKLVNLQFCKDAVALEHAVWYRLSPFRMSRSKFWNYGKLVDLTFGNILGKLFGAGELLTHAHNSRNIEHIHSYVIQYLERDRYGTTN